jgi:hypothetical protein
VRNRSKINNIFTSGFCSKFRESYMPPAIRIRVKVLPLTGVEDITPAEDSEHYHGADT